MNGFFCACPREWPPSLNVHVRFVAFISAYVSHEVLLGVEIQSAGEMFLSVTDPMFLFSIVSAWFPLQVFAIVF